MAGIFEPKMLLGKVQPVLVQEFAGQKIVINMFTQLNYGRKKGVLYTDYDALSTALDKISRAYPGESIAIPQGMACDRAGGDWLKVERMIADKLKNMKVKFYIKI